MVVFRTLSNITEIGLQMNNSNNEHKRHKWVFKENHNVVIKRYRAYPVAGLAATTLQGLYECDCGELKWGSPQSKKPEIQEK